ncbi:hypothetical protein Aspvir_000377 [Aspergillus viridinutans]|uniref:Citrate exporter 1 n=1 Tax=Aspergillus viridinutans TaxID=75553 RepID=A0A9P3BS95_ASPVI|nr:uncharacterized protein Aspvir_000377 [Aspergillus viridinutans]GIJ98261.1 hypothetical protein Aspvir_000377 [Aspergillus viridinutans]
MADGKHSASIPSKQDILGQFTAEEQLPTLCETEEGAESESAGPCYSVLSEREKLLTVSIASLATFLSPLSASIYYPSIEAVARDLHVSNNTINLTVTSFKVFQGIAPLVTGSLSDQTGRRATLMISLILYVGINVGLAVQTSFLALIVLRSLQSIFSSTVAIVGTATTADVVSGAERGKYMAYTVLGATVGPALGPVVGGILSHYLGWRSSFWFLTIFAGVLLLLVVILLPETCRAVVGNGSVVPQKWNYPLKDVLFPGRRSTPPQYQTITTFKQRPTPWNTLKLVWDKEAACTILFSAIIYAGYLSITTTLPFELGRHYGFNALQIGLCYLSYGSGSLTSRWTAGTLMNWNFRRFAHHVGFDIHDKKELKLTTFPLEKARLQVALPLVYIASVFIVVYAWVLNFEVQVAVPLLMLFLVAHALSGITSTLTTLIIDCHAEQPATATAAMNFFRSLFGAGAAAAAVPLIDRINVGWTGTLLGLLCVSLSPLAWMVFIFGHSWRLQKEGRLSQ